MPKAIVLLYAATLFIALHGAAHAQPAVTGPAAGGPAVPDEWERHPLAAELALGIAAPTGLVGVDIHWCPMSWLSLEGGVGENRDIFFGGGVQFAVMPRLQAAVRGLAVSFGVGASVGAFHHCDGCPFENGDKWTWSSAHWVNADLAIEYRWRLGLGVRLLLGAGRMVNPNDYTCDPHGITCGQLFFDARGIHPYIGLGFVIPLTPAMR